MASSSLLGSLLQIVPPKKLGTNGGASATPTFDENQKDRNIARPTGDSHRQDLSLFRQQTDDKDIVESMMRTDTEMSATTHSYLTVGNTQMRYLCRDVNKGIDRAAQKLIDQVVVQLTTAVDYSLGFQRTRSLNARNEALRYMLLKRGGIMLELVITKNVITDARLVDVDTVDWKEVAAGQMKPEQRRTSGDPVSLDYPTVFYATFRGDPSDAYSTSFFISTINTIYARKQILNDFYRIIKLQGFPRLDITLVEEVIRRNAPMPYQKNPSKMREYIEEIISATGQSFSAIKPDQPVVHTDNTEIKVINEKASGVSLDVTPIINVLNGQNQAGLKIMATLIGRGESGVNTASTEARIFALSAAEVNVAIADIWSQLLTFILRYNGSTSYCEVFFDEPELRSKDERESNLLLRQQRLLADLSWGLITDDEYHLIMYGRLAPDGAKLLSGTQFLVTTAADALTAASANRTTKDQPNSVERQATKGGTTAKQTTSKATK